MSRHHAERQLELGRFKVPGIFWFPAFVFSATIEFMTWKEFFQHNMDKVLLIFLLHAIMALMVTTLKSDPSIADWLRGEASTVMGALIMLITGRASKPDPTVTASTTTTQSVTVPPIAADSGDAEKATS